MLNLSALRTLVEVEKIGSFALAADRLGLTLSAASAQLKKLEQDLNADLFDRSVRPPAMTPEARRVAGHAQRILAEFEAIQSVGTSRDALDGIYRIGFIPTAMVRLMPQFLTAAARLHPEATFTVESGLTADLVRRLLQSELDVALLTEMQGTDPELIFHPLFTERFVLAVPAKAKRWSLARCAAALTHVKLDRPASGIDKDVARRFAELDIACRATQAMDSVEAAMECVNAGLAFAVLPEPDIRRYATGAVVRHTKDFDFPRHVGLATRRDSPMRNRIDAFATLIPRPDQDIPPSA